MANRDGLRFVLIGNQPNGLGEAPRAEFEAPVEVYVRRSSVCGNGEVERYEDCDDGNADDDDCPNLLWDLAAFAPQAYLYKYHEHPSQWPTSEHYGTQDGRKWNRLHGGAMNLLRTVNQ